jgi:hypothetical protein
MAFEPNIAISPTRIPPAIGIAITNSPKVLFAGVEWAIEKFP